MTLNIRTLTRCFWVMVEEKEKNSREVVEKASAINLLVAFAYATRNYLREEYSYEQDDLRELINHIPRFSTPSSNQPLEVQEDDKTAKCGAEGRGNLEIRLRTRVDSTTSSKLSAKKARTYNIMAYETPVPTNIPIELSYYIASYINSVRQRGLVDPSTVTVMNNGMCVTVFFSFYLIYFHVNIVCLIVKQCLFQ